MPEARREQFLERPLPNSEESERLILGGILLNNDLMSSVAEGLCVTDFYSPLTRRVFQAMLELYASNTTIDPILIAEELKKDGPIESIGGVSTIVNFSAGLPHFTRVDEYVRLVKEKSTLRRLIRVCNEATTLALEEDTPVEQVLQTVEQNLYNLSSDEVTGIVSAQQSVAQVLANSRLAAERGEALTGLATGFDDIDSRTLGLQNGNLIIIAARPSMGKSALGMDIARHISFRLNLPTIFFSLEMSEDQLSTRILSSESGINSQRIKTGQLTDEEWTQLEEITNSLNNNLFIDDTPAISVSYIRNRIRRLRTTAGAPIAAVFVDYLQLMSGDTREGREREVSKISRDLKSLAKEFNIPVIAFSQLNRSPEARRDKLPTLGDLRESGAIEQDADVVAFIFREDHYRTNPAEMDHLASIILAKQRNGPTGTISLRFNSTTATFQNLPPEQF